MIKSAKPITHLLRENYADGTLTRGSCFKHAVLYSSGGRLSMWQTDCWTRRGKSGSSGEKDPLHQPCVSTVMPLSQGLPLGVKSFHIPIVPELIRLSPLRENPQDCLFRPSWPCGAWFIFFFCSKLSIKRQFHISQSGFRLQTLPAYPRALGLHNHSFIGTGRKF